MISNSDFVKQSLALHLFFVRIMKEHSFFLEAGFTPKDDRFIRQADDFRIQFDRLLGEVAAISNGVVSPDVLLSGEVVTPYTLNAEMASAYYTGVMIPFDLTRIESQLTGDTGIEVNSALERRVYLINQKSIGLVSELIRFKEIILSNVLSCKMFTVNYPLLIDHIMREAKLYRNMIQRLQNREEINIEKEAMEQELFWNRIMAEHSKFIRGLLDPTENQLINTANDFGNEFDKLTAEVNDAMNQTALLGKVTEESLNAAQRIRDFKEQGTQGLINCKIKSIIIPLLGDHVLREASHFLRLLKLFNKSI